MTWTAQNMTRFLNLIRRQPRRRLLGALVLILLTAGPAWSIDRGVTLPDQPRFERFANIDEAARRACASLQAHDVPMRRQPVKLDQVQPEKLLPAALYGLAVGARYATGPLQKHDLIPASATAATKAQAIANWRRCLADATLRANQI